MATSILGNGPPYTVIYPTSRDLDPHVDDFRKIHVDDGVIQLDKASHSDEYAHIFLSGTLQSHENYIRIKDGGNQELLKVDYQGKITAPGVTAPEITSLQNTQATSVQSITALQTSQGTQDTAISALQTSQTAQDASITGLVSGQTTQDSASR